MDERFVISRFPSPLKYASSSRLRLPVCKRCGWRRIMEEQNTSFESAENVKLKKLEWELLQMKEIVSEQSRTMARMESLVTTLDHEFEVVATSVNYKRGELSLSKQLSNGPSSSSVPNSSSFKAPGQASQSFKAAALVKEWQGKRICHNCGQKWRSKHHSKSQRVCSNDDPNKPMENHKLLGVEVKHTSISKDIIISHVLPRLPGKLLCRFRCVCRKWDELILEDRTFAQSQSQMHKEVSGFFYSSPVNGLNYASIDESAGVPDESLSFLVNSEHIVMVAASNGLVVCQEQTNKSFFYICNPTTKEYSTLWYYPDMKYFLPVFGLAFDPSISVSAFKLVCCFVHEDKRSIGFDIFSSRTGEWMPSSVTFPWKLKSSSKGPANGTGIFVGGNIYWLFESSIVCSFDVDNDYHHLIQLPKLTYKTTCQADYIAEFEGHLSYVQNTESHVGMEVRVWILKNSSTSEWMRMYRVSLEAVSSKYSELLVLPGPEHSFDDGTKCRLLPLQCSNMALLLIWPCGKHFVYHFRTRKLNEVRISSYYADNFTVCINSLAPVPPINDV